jgi:Asp-tRNA(Asn)/Glu-tRNA(Gln) amidotransferase C subunit
MSEKYSIELLFNLAKIDKNDGDFTQNFDNVITWCEALKKVDSIYMDDTFTPNPKLQGILRKDASKETKVLESLQKEGEYFVTKRVIE